MTEYELLTQGAGHSLAPTYDGRDPMRNRPLIYGTDTSMTIQRYGLGREHTNMIGSPAIVGCADGEYVRHADHAALISELQAELTGLESIVVAQTVTIAELRVDHSGGANDMVGIPAPPPRDWPKIQAYIGEYVGGYEMIGEDDQGRDGCHIPTDGERALIKDAIHGLLGESDFDALYHPQPPKCSTCNGTGIIPGDTTGEVFRPTMVCIDCAQPRRLGGRQTASFRPSTHAPYATPPADGQTQQEVVVGDLSALVKQSARAMGKAAPGNGLPKLAMDYLKRKGLQGSPLRSAQQDADKVDAQPLTAKKRFDDAFGDSETDPIERLRFFCSIAMSGQDWLDVEPFFDELTEKQPDPAMPGDDISDEEIRSAIKTALYTRALNCSDVAELDRDIAAFLSQFRMLLARKRVQPASREDAT